MREYFVNFAPYGYNYTYNIFGNDNLGQVRNNSGTVNKYYYLKDHLGNIKMTVNSTGGVVGYDDYYPYGMQMSRRSLTGSADARYKFVGNERDAETGDDYFGARYYDSELGRWMSVDPLASKYPGWSPYVYSLDNPINLFDPNGLEVKAVRMMGRDRFHPLLKERTYYLDVKIADKVIKFVQDARKKFPQISVNNTFRLEPSSSIQTSNAKAKGLSNHQAGFAIDLNGVGTLTKEQIGELNKIANEAGLEPLKNQEKDLPHFEASPTNYGYESLKEAVKENRTDYLEKIKTKNKEKGKKER